MNVLRTLAVAFVLLRGITAMLPKMASGDYAGAAGNLTGTLLLSALIIWGASRIRRFTRPKGRPVPRVPKQRPTEP